PFSFPSNTSLPPLFLRLDFHRTHPSARGTHRGRRVRRIAARHKPENIPPAGPQPHRVTVRGKRSRRPHKFHCRFSFKRILLRPTRPTQIRIRRNSPQSPSPGRIIRYSFLEISVPQKIHDPVRVRFPQIERQLRQFSRRKTNENLGRIPHASLDFRFPSPA